MFIEGILVDKMNGLTIKSDWGAAKNILGVIVLLGVIIGVASFISYKAYGQDTVNTQIDIKIKPLQEDVEEIQKDVEEIKKQMEISSKEATYQNMKQTLYMEMIVGEKAVKKVEKLTKALKPKEIK